jgi:uncharacterized protein (DUF983 family)
MMMVTVDVNDLPSYVVMIIIIIVVIVVVNVYMFYFFNSLINVWLTWILLRTVV